MKMLGGPTSMKKYIATMVLFSVIVTTFIVTRNKRSFVNDYGSYEETIETKQKIPLKFSANVSSKIETPVKLSANVQSKIETLVLFIGYSRSGHTIIGSLLDAHPHIVISNELDIFERWKEWSKAEKTRENLINKIYENSYKQSQGSGFRSATKDFGRTYAVPNQWQGNYKDYIKVIGDKKGGKTSKFLSTQKHQELTKDVLDKIDLPIRFIHMVRNPYDNIATMTFRSLQILTDKAKASEKKINDTKAIKTCMRFYLWEAYNNYNLIKRYGTKVLTLHSEDVIANPKKQLKKLCRFLEVTCSEDYLNDCSSIIYKKTSKTRTTIVWQEAHKREVEKAIKDIPFLRRYTF